MANTIAIKKKPVKKAPQCQVVISVDDHEYKAEAATFGAALKKLVQSDNHPDGAKTRAIVTFRSGNKETSQVWMPVKARRMFNALATKDWSIEVLVRDMTARLA